MRNCRGFYGQHGYREQHGMHEDFGFHEDHGGFGCHGMQYVPSKEISRVAVEETVKNVLANAKKGEKFVDGRSYYHAPIVINGGIVGMLFEDVDLADVAVGGYWVGRVGIKVELVKDEIVVGFVHVAV
jgi:hypothetical protein